VNKKIILLIGLLPILFNVQCKESPVSPPYERDPVIEIEYPDDRDYTHLVGEGATLLIKGKTVYTERILIIVDDRIIDEIITDSFKRKIEFKTIISDFGSPGIKDIIVRGIGESVINKKIQIENNQVKIQQMAMQFVGEQFSKGERIMRLLNLSNGPLAYSVRIKVPAEAHAYLSAIEEGAKFWKLFADIDYRIIPVNEQSAPDCYPNDIFGYIYIDTSFKENGSWSCPRGGGYEIVGGVIYFYAPWVFSNSFNAYVISHEMGHFLGMGHSSGHNTVMDGGDYLIHPFQALAIRIAYSKNPGDPI